MFNKIFSFFSHHEQQVRQDRWIYWTILVASTLSLLAAFVLSVDAIELAKNPDVQLSCNINSVISCGEVGKTSYASLFGFPNSFIGLMVEPMFIVFAIAGLFGVKFPRQFMIGVQIAAIISLAFAYWLFFIGNFVIGALCPWCLLVDISTTVAFAAITRFNIIHGNIPYLSRKSDKICKDFVRKDFDKLAVAVILLFAFALMILEFGSSLFGQ